MLVAASTDTDDLATINVFMKSLKTPQG